jgi:hypothetical protein
MRKLHKFQKEGHILRLINVAFEKGRSCRACQAGKQVDLIPQMILLHPHKTMSKIKRMNKMKIKLMIKRKALIKGEIRMMGIIKHQEQSHHIQESTKPCKGINPWTTFLVISKRG